MRDKYTGIQLVLFDVDGVLTDGGLNITSEGEIYKQFNVKDGVAIALLKAHGIRTGVVSGKQSAALDYRCKQLALDVIITGCSDKLSAAQRLVSEMNIAPSQIVFVGDDIIDLSVMDFVGVSYSPADGHVLAKRRADIILECPGGAGVAREVAEHILFSRGLSLEEMYQPLLIKDERTIVVQ
ncbi:KdsC family phosphatase [Microbulbifer aggregans]|uniref:KdsC family phosphatase n=1 Tax=Microbulbifer aggregans TaxID=1769779 RepID=UPI001CFE8421|nr:HAD-IIIA family hydrolase [Microbulbifer aggregans]